jgi:hypothetical protein
LSVRDAGEGRRALAQQASPGHDPDVRRLEMDLSRALGTKVAPSAREGRAGTLEIAYFSDDDLARVAEQILGRRRAAHSAGS